MSHSALHDCSTHFDASVRKRNWKISTASWEQQSQATVGATCGREALLALPPWCSRTAIVNRMCPVPDHRILPAYSFSARILHLRGRERLRATAARHGSRSVTHGAQRARVVGPRDRQTSRFPGGRQVAEAEQAGQFMCFDRDHPHSERRVGRRWCAIVARRPAHIPAYPWQIHSPTSLHSLGRCCRHPARLHRVQTPNAPSSVRSAPSHRWLFGLTLLLRDCQLRLVHTRIPSNCQEETGKNRGKTS